MNVGSLARWHAAQQPYSGGGAPGWMDGWMLSTPLPPPLPVARWKAAHLLSVRLVIAGGLQVFSVLGG